MFAYLQSILEEPWKLVSRLALVAWLIFYVGFLGYAISAHGAGLFIDNANLVVHEGGHNLFGWFGPTLGLWGGTLLQWLVPFLLAAYFFKERQTAGFVFCLFFFFENWPNMRCRTIWSKSASSTPMSNDQSSATSAAIPWRSLRQKALPDRRKMRLLL